MTEGYSFSFSLSGTPPPKRAPLQSAEIVRTYEHDRGAFTQGLLFCEGRLFESTGLEGNSELREVRLEDGAVLRRTPFPSSAWGEGIVDWRDEIIGLTLRNGIALRWDRDSFAKRGEFRYEGQGWGLTRNDQALIMSDGTPVLRILDPESFAVRRRLTVIEGGRPLGHLNDLAWVKGEIFANLFMTDTIARIDPATGEVKARIDLTALVTGSGRRGVHDVLNGIAYDAAEDRLFVTGKNWPSLYEIDMVPRAAAPAATQ